MEAVAMYSRSSGGRESCLITKFIPNLKTSTKVHIAAFKSSLYLKSLSGLTRATLQPYPSSQVPAMLCPRHRHEKATAPTKDHLGSQGHNELPSQVDG